MKRVKKDALRQERRARALARFRIDPKRTNDTVYVARKEQEQHALRTVLGST